MKNLNQTGFIASVDSDKLDQASIKGEIDASSCRLQEAEQKYIGAWRKARGDAEPEAGEVQNLVGLALSGGGIRSATFSLGVMQALAQRGLLKKVDYLSTVSGGGYIGSALTWLVSDKAQQEYSASGAKEAAAVSFGLDRENFPFGADDPAPGAERKANELQQRMLKYLRQHGYYLTPGAGIGAFSLLGVVLRSTLLNLLVWMPIFVLFFLFGMWGSEQFNLNPPGFGNPPIMSWIITAVEPDAGCSKHIPSEILTSPPSTDAVCATIKSQEAFAFVTDRLAKLFGFELFLWLALAILALLLTATLVYSIATWFRRGTTRSKREFWYNARRRSETGATILIPLALLTLIIGTLPIVAVYLHSWLLAAGPMAMLTGIAVTIRHFLASASSEGGTPPGITVSLGAGLFLYGVILVSYQIAFLSFPFGLAPYPALAPLIIVPAVTGWFVNLNYIAIHRYYRDRLMETFMPDIGDALENKTDAALGADGATLQGISDPKAPRGPYHIVNTNLVLVNSADKTYKDRGGDNFILSPLYCGSNATGWCQTKDFMKGYMTLATAVAISGAAANPNTGVGGKGLTRNLLVSLVMSLLNLRLGYWACHPDPKKRPFHGPNHFPGSYAFGNASGLGVLGFNEHRPFLQLSDGGHFENMGVYELVRRRMGLIIVCDGGADAEFSFSDFQTTLRRIEDDFGVQVQALDGATPDDIVPVPRKGAVYPKEASFAKQGHMLARITYADGSQGILIYLKTTLADDLSFKVKGYAAQNSNFPDQSTADQFFDEVQFEAYRELGFRLTDKMMKSKVPEGIAKSGESTNNLEQLIRNRSAV